VEKRIAIVGGGPSGMFVFKRLIEGSCENYKIDIFETSSRLGAGMPYSEEGANKEHITNVSANEIPAIVTSLGDWIGTLSSTELEDFDIKSEEFNDYKVMPRLLFGKYLSAQFDLLLAKAENLGIRTKIHYKSRVADVFDKPKNNSICLIDESSRSFEFDCVILCTGHVWPQTKEGRVKGYFDSPYPPKKIAARFNHAIAIRGSSLTAIDAIRTLAINNGSFVRDGQGKLSFHSNKDSNNFKIVMHSRHGLLPVVRHYLEDPHFSKRSLLSREELMRHKEENGGFISLDYVFEKDFKELFLEKAPEFYLLIKDMSLEEFVESMMRQREDFDPFLYFKWEYEEAKKSIMEKRPLYWKELLATLSFALNYPAKYLSAEDWQRLEKILMPLISIVIAFVPQSSCEQLFALHEAGRLEIVSTGEESNIEINPEGGIFYNRVPYETFIDCTGQKHMCFKEFPFKRLISEGTVIPSHLRYRAADACLPVPGIAINDEFQAVDSHGRGNPRLFIMAVPYIGGFNPDYSGLDFCEEASKRIVEEIFAAV
jgi:uncharacterized NAD(P)/FAD-binding protein YdhS